MITHDDQYTTDYNRGKPGQHSAFVGNSIKSMHNSVNDSLKKLRTDYIDILYVHWWDYTAAVEEVMDGLHTLIMQGKVLYLGVSDTPAWIVSKANNYARMSGRTPFVIYQGMWSIMHRDFERDILPMAVSEGKLWFYLSLQNTQYSLHQAWHLPLGTFLPADTSAPMPKSSAALIPTREAVLPSLALGYELRRSARSARSSSELRRRSVHKTSPPVSF